MSFTIRLHARATADLDGIHTFLSEYSSEIADRTYATLKARILSLADFPRRCAPAPESVKSSVEIRQLSVGNYRVLFSIIGDSVSVWRVLHAAQRPLDPSDLF